MNIRIELAYDREDIIKELFSEYVEMILNQSEDVKQCLESQHYDDELLDLSEKYGLPDNRLYLAYLDDDVVGCVALRKIDDTYCEMKRLYIRSGYRGKHIGRILIKTIISDAKLIGYTGIRLDTFPFMESAIRLYEHYGFKNIERYNDNPAPTALYLQLDL